jgi:hypothetical protein
MNSLGCRGHTRCSKVRGSGKPAQYIAKLSLNHRQRETARGRFLKGTIGVIPDGKTRAKISGAHPMPRGRSRLLHNGAGGEAHISSPRKMSQTERWLTLPSCHIPVLAPLSSLRACADGFRRYVDRASWSELAPLRRGCSLRERCARSSCWQINSRNLGPVSPPEAGLFFERLSRRLAAWVMVRRRATIAPPRRTQPNVAPPSSGGLLVWHGSQVSWVGGATFGLPPNHLDVAAHSHPARLAALLLITPKSTHCDFVEAQL